jgi:hypothetical protein
MVLDGSQFMEFWRSGDPGWVRTVWLKRNHAPSRDNLRTVRLKIPLNQQQRGVDLKYRERVLQGDNHNEKRGFVFTWESKALCSLNLCTGVSAGLT